MSCAALEPTLGFFVEKLGFRIDAIHPADNPSIAEISGHGLAIRLVKGATGGVSVVYLLCDDPEATGAGATSLRAPNGVIVELVAENPQMSVPATKQALALTRASGDALARHVGAPVRPAGQPGAVQPARAPLGEQRARVEPVRPRAELRMLHGQHAPGLAEAGGEPLDGVARRGTGRRGLRPQPGAGARDARTTGDDRGADRLSVPRGRRAHRPAGRAAPVPAAPAHSVVGRRRGGHGERSAGARRRAWRVPANRARLAAWRRRADASACAPGLRWAWHAASPPLR